VTAATSVASWVEQAGCRAMPTRLWFSSEPLEQAVAIAICRRCEVGPPCLEDALAVELDGRRYGIRGGLLPGERARRWGRVWSVEGVEDVVVEISIDVSDSSGLTNRSRNHPAKLSAYNSRPSPVLSGRTINLVLSTVLTVRSATSRKGGSRDEADLALIGASPPGGWGCSA